MTDWPPFVDTNVLLRLLLADHEDHSPAARDYFRGLRETGRVAGLTPAIVSEVVFVLQGPRYRRSREEIASALELVLQLPLHVVDREEVQQAISLYRTVHPDWDDALLAAYAISRADGELVSFDIRLARIPGVQRISPAAGIGE